MKTEKGSFRLLRVFANSVRIEIVRLLLRFEMLSLTDIAMKLYEGELKMSLPGLLKHMKILEEAGIVRNMPGGLGPEPDARKNLYLLEGKERVERILQQVETHVVGLLLACEIFHNASRLAPRVLDTGPKLFREERKHFESLLEQCEDEKIFKLLTEDERMKVRFWRKMVSL